MKTRTRLPFRLLAATAAFALATVAILPASAGDRVDGDPRSDTPAFVFDRGHFFAFDLPGGGSGEFVRMNDRGVIVGSFADDDGTLTGFKLDQRGRFETFDAPDGDATPLDVNNRGWIVGNVCDSPAECSVSTRGFLRDPKGRFTTIRKPGAVRTQVFGVNDRGQVVGDYLLPDGSIHGYRWSNGRFTNIGGPGGADATLTGINDRGDIIGAYLLDPTNPTRGLKGFLLRNGRYDTFAVPDVRHTLPLGINNRGQIAGYTATGDDLATGARGFLYAKGLDRSLTRIDVPGAATTGVTGIDDDGRLVGIYDNRKTDSSSSRISSPTTATDMLALSLKEIRTR
jgi:probable HAF family extracellular repeat protein